MQLVFVHRERDGSTFTHVGIAQSAYGLHTASVLTVAQHGAKTVVMCVVLLQLRGCLPLLLSTISQEVR